MKLPEKISLKFPEKVSFETSLPYGDQKGPSIFLKIGYSNKQDVLIPNLASKIVYGF